MARNRYLSTTNAQTLLSPDQSGRKAAISISGQALEVAGRNFENKLAAAERSARETRARGQLAAEKKRQLELNIPEAARNIQRAQLNTLNTLLGLQEGARQQKEAQEAKAFSLKANNETSLGFLKAQKEIAQGVKPNGEGLLENTKAWWDAKEAAIIESAPSEKAKIKALETFYAQKTNALGDAIVGEMKAKEAFIQRQVLSAQEDLITETRFNPATYEESLKGFDAIAANLSESGFSKEQIEDQKKLFNKNLLTAKLETELERSSFQADLLKNVEETLSVKENRSLLGEDKVKQLVTKYFKQGEAVTNKKIQQETELRLRGNWIQGNLTPHNPKHKEFVKQEFRKSNEAIEQQVAQIQDPKQRAEAYSALKIEFAKFSSFIPKEEIQASEFRLTNTQDPAKAVAEANYILNLSRDKNTITKFDGYSKEALTRAAMLNAFTSSQGLTPEAAVAEVNKSFDRQLDGNAINARARVLEDSKKGLRKETLYKEVFNKDADDLLERVYADVDQSFLFGFGNHLEEEAAQFKYEYEEELKGVYELVGNEQQAIEITDMLMRQKLGVTVENGVERIMTNAPEQIFQGEAKTYFDAVKKSKFESLRNGKDIENFQLVFEAIDGEAVRYKVVDKRNNLPIKESVNGYEQDARLRVSMKGGKQYSLAKERAEITNPTSSFREYLIKGLEENKKVPFQGEHTDTGILNGAAKALIGILFPEPMTLEQQEKIFGKNNPEYIASQKEKVRVIDQQLEDLNG